jgi:predicted DNA-binding transcriptional regulator AlpA
VSDERLLTAREVAQILRMSDAWVRDHATKRRRPFLPCVRFGKSIRFTREHVDIFIRQCEEQQAAA